MKKVWLIVWAYGHGHGCQVEGPFATREALDARLAQIEATLGPNDRCTLNNTGFYLANGADVCVEEIEIPA